MPRYRAATTTGSPGSGASRLDALEGLRATAALAVVAFHLSVLTHAFRAGWLGSAFLQLDVGVWIFFVLSGFLLYTPFARAHAGTSRVPLGSYARRRFLRIYPAYWVALALVPWLLAPAWRFASWSDAIRGALLVDSYKSPHIPTTPGLPQAWSLVVEVSFYAFLPVYAIVIGAVGRRWSRPRVEWVGLVILATIGVLATAWPGAGAPLWVRVLPQYLTPFAVGMAAAVARVQAVRWPRPGPWIATGFVAWCTVVVVSIVGHSPSGVWWNVFVPLGFTVAAGGLVVPLIDPGAPGRIAAVARSRAMVALGRVSYGIFLWHYGAIIWVTEHWFDPRGSFTFEKCALVVVPFTLVAAWLSYHLVERPAMALAHRRVPRAPSSSED